MQVIETITEHIPHYVPKFCAIDLNSDINQLTHSSQNSIEDVTVELQESQESQESRASQASTVASSVTAAHDVSSDSVAKIAMSQQHIRSLLAGEQLSKYNTVMSLESSQLSDFIVANQKRNELLLDALKSSEDLLQSNKNVQDQLDQSRQTIADQQKELSQMTDKLAEAQAMLSEKEKVEKSSQHAELIMTAKNEEISDLRKRLSNAESWISSKRSKLSEISTELNAALEGMPATNVTANFNVY